MKLKNNELEKKEVLINRVRLETQSEELLEHLLEEMNKQLIVYMPLMILCMLKIKELKKLLKEMVQFFVLELQDIVFLVRKFYKMLKFSSLTNFFMNFNSLYLELGSLYWFQYRTNSILCIRIWIL
jgi:hypothetical protein